MPPILQVLIIGGVAFYAALINRQQKVIAAQQAETARHKLRLDLYNRRYEIYSTALNYRNLLLTPWSTPPDFDKYRFKFIGALLESRFLFYPEIHEKLQIINNSSDTVIAWVTAPEEMRNNVPLKEDYYRATMLIGDTFSQLHQLFLPYLDFSSTVR